MIPRGCKRLAEVDFPIAEVSRHAVREKSIRHGHPSTLHLWWARRPLASSRAMLMALLLPDPCDPHCPEEFRRAAVPAIGVRVLRHLHQDRLSPTDRRPGERPSRQGPDEEAGRSARGRSSEQCMARIRRYRGLDTRLDSLCAAAARGVGGVVGLLRRRNISDDCSQPR